MPGFEEFINDFHFDAETFNEDQFKNAAKAAFDEDAQHHTAELSTRDERITELDTKARDMGLALWNAQMKQGPKVPPADPNRPPVPDEGDGEHKPKDIKSFFKKVER